MSKIKSEINGSYKRIYFDAIGGDNMNYGENREYKSMGRGEVRTSNEILNEIQLRYLEKELRKLHLKSLK